MSLRRLLRTPVTIRHRARTGDRDGYGDAATVETTTTTRGRLDPVATASSAGDRPGEAITALLVLPADVDVDASDRVDVDGRTWSIVGEPHRVRTPRGAVSHVECVVQAAS